MAETVTDPNATSSWFSDLFSTNNIQNLLSGVANVATTKEMMDTVAGYGADAQSMAETIAGSASKAAQFQPFTVTSDPALNALKYTVDDTTGKGTLDLGISAGQQEMTKTALENAKSLLSNLGMGTDARTADIYSALQSARAPEIERQRLQQQQDMFNQGRMGLGSAMYGGGSPEEYARQQALLDQQSKDYLSALTGAQSEQTANANLLGTMMNQAYAPQTQALNLLQGVVPMEQLAQSGRMSGAEAYQAAISPILQAETAGNKAAADIYNTYLNSLSGMFAPAGAATVQGGNTQSVADSLGGVVSAKISEGFNDLYNKIFG